MHGGVNEMPVASPESMAVLQLEDGVVFRENGLLASLEKLLVAPREGPLISGLK